MRGSLAGALEAIRPEAVVIATPTHTHDVLALEAAQRRVAVFVEKPLARDLVSAANVAAALRASEATASCGDTLAYLPTFERAQELLSAGVLGRVEGFRAEMEIGQVLGPKRGWMYEAARSGGGVLANVASHALFLLHWYFGDVVEVHATTRSLHTPLDDEAAVGLRFSGGIGGELVTSWSVPGLSLSRTAIEVWGENGSLRVDQSMIATALKEPGAGMPAGEQELRLADLARPAAFDLGGEGYCRELEDFIAAVRWLIDRDDVEGAVNVAAPNRSMAASGWATTSPGAPPSSGRAAS